MDYRQNFKTALKEIFLLQKSQNREESPAEKQDIAALVTEAETAAPKLTLTQPRKNDRKKTDPSVISEDTAINGEVVSKGSLDIRGIIVGNVVTKGDIVISGSVEGNISGENIDLKACKITGDLAAEGTIKIGKDTEIVGSMISREIFVDGKVSGNISSSADAYFRQGAFVIGNVTTNMIAIERGGVICGEVTIGSAALNGDPQNRSEEARMRIQAGE